MPQRYRPASSDQTRALQAPVRRRLAQMPTGQGSSRQQAPQPLQGWPSAGLGGAEE